MTAPIARVTESLDDFEQKPAQRGSSLALFVLAWAGQFIGHTIEGKKPSFFEDLQFLLIGPRWLLGSVYRRAGIQT